MKKLTTTLLVAVFTMLATVFAQISSDIMMGPSFTIKNHGSGQVVTAPVGDFSFPWGKEVYLEGGFCNGDKIEITYNSFASSRLAWFYGWVDFDSEINKSLGTEKTAKLTVEDVPTDDLSCNTLLVKCNYLGTEYGGGTPKTYLIYFRGVSQEKRITAKNSGASEVQVSYKDYEKVSAGQRASVALYDIYGNLVSTGYLDGLGMSTLSTKGKSGIYVVKVMMNNQVVFNQRIQVK